MSAVIPEACEGRVAQEGVGSPCSETPETSVPGERAAEGQPAFQPARGVLPNSQFMVLTSPAEGDGGSAPLQPDPTAVA